MAESKRLAAAYGALGSEHGDLKSMVDWMALTGNSIDADAIQNGLGFLKTFSDLGGNLGDLPGFDKLIDEAGNLKGAGDLEGDSESLTALQNALSALYELAGDKAVEEDEKVAAYEAEIAAIQATLDNAMATIASLEAELANAESLKERIEDGETLEGILSEISAEPYTATVEVDDQVTEGVENAEQALDGINGKTVNTYIKVTTVPVGGDVDGSHAGGLDRVPFDGYIAQLHAGEAVLTRSEASLWRAEKEPHHL